MLGDDEKLADDNATSMVDEALADIVLLKRNEMEEWERRQTDLRD